MSRGSVRFYLVLGLLAIGAFSGIWYLNKHTDRTYWLKIDGNKIRANESRTIKVPYHSWRAKKPYRGERETPNVTEVRWNTHCQDLEYFRVYTDGYNYHYVSNIDRPFGGSYFVLAEGKKIIEAYNPKGKLISRHIIEIKPP